MTMWRTFMALMLVACWGGTNAEDALGTSDGCTLSPGATSGQCGGEGGFSVGECKDASTNEPLKVQAAFTVDMKTCKTKTETVLDDCAQKHLAGVKPLPDACKVSSFTFEVKPETTKTDAWKNARMAATPAGIACNQALGVLVNSWYLTAVELVMAESAKVCGFDSSSSGGRRLLEAARIGTPVLLGGIDPSAVASSMNTVSPSSCSAQSCTGTAHCASGNLQRSSGSAIKAYSCASSSEEESLVRRLGESSTFFWTRRRRRASTRRRRASTRRRRAPTPAPAPPPSTRRRRAPTPAPAPPPSTRRRRAPLTLENKMDAGYRWNCANNLGCVGDTFTFSQVQTAAKTFSSGSSSLSSSSLSKMACAAGKQANSCTFSSTAEPVQHAVKVHNDQIAMQHIPPATSQGSTSPIR